MISHTETPSLFQHILATDIDCLSVYVSNKSMINHKRVMNCKKNAIKLSAAEKIF